MNRRKRVIRNIVLLAVLTFLFCVGQGASLSPISAHENWERSMHYGPSKVVHIEDIPGGKLILAKYDRWVTCNPVNRTLFFFWMSGGGGTGYEYSRSKPLAWNGSGSSERHALYGIINDKSIERVEVTLTDGTVLSTTDFYDDMFLFTWENSEAHRTYMKSIRGYDAEGNLVYEETLPPY